LEASLRSFFARWNSKKENESVKNMAEQYVESEEELCLLLQRDFHGTDHTFAVKKRESEEERSKAEGGEAGKWEGRGEQARERERVRESQSSHFFSTPFSLSLALSLSHSLSLVPSLSSPLSVSLSLSRSLARAIA